MPPLSRRKFLAVAEALAVVDEMNVIRQEAIPAHLRQRREDGRRYRGQRRRDGKLPAIEPLRAFPFLSLKFHDPAFELDALDLCPVGTVFLDGRGAARILRQVAAMAAAR